jgi:RimJ/RimL family protein N-acetyltransferase
VTIGEPICGELVCLGPLRIEMAPDWVRWMADAATTEYLYAPGQRPNQPFTPDAALDWGRRMLADPQRVIFALTDRASGQVVGDARLTPSGRGRMRYSIMIGEAAARSRGLGTEATRLICRYGFELLGLREIDLEVDPRNQRAVRAYLTAGFSWKGTRLMRLSESEWRGTQGSDP